MINTQAKQKSYIKNANLEASDWIHNSDIFTGGILTGENEPWKKWKFTL